MIDKNHFRYLVDNRVGNKCLILDENGETYKIKIAIAKNPQLFPYYWEQSITNGIGYLPVRKAIQEIKVHTTQGLREHLKNMYHIQSMRADSLLKGIYEEQLKNMLILDENIKQVINKLLEWIAENFLPKKTKNLK